MKQGQRWNVDDYISLCDMWKRQVSLYEMAIVLERSPGAIVNRLNVMHLVKYDRSNYSFFYRCDDKIKQITPDDIRKANLRIKVMPSNEKSIQGNLQEVSQVGETTSGSD